MELPSIVPVDFHLELWEDCALLEYKGFIDAAAEPGQAST